MRRIEKKKCPKYILQIIWQTVDSSDTLFGNVTWILAKIVLKMSLIF